MSSTRRRRALATIGLLAVAACGTAAAEPPPSPPPPERHPALTVLDRLSRAEATPGTVGRSAADAVALLTEAGLEGHVVALSDDPVVSAQYPEGGAPVPADGQVVVWVGTPAAPPEPEPGPEPESEPTGEAGGEPEPQASSSLAAAPTGGVAAAPVDLHGTDSAPTSDAATAVADDPTPSRAGIRTMPAAPIGTVLAGSASWYGPGFEGRTTACGGPFDPARLTLASRELRCDTVVRVIGPSGHAVIAVVTDYGPAEWTNRRFDLSAATFASIQPLGSGVTSVHVEVVGP